MQDDVVIDLPYMCDDLSKKKRSLHLYSVLCTLVHLPGYEKKTGFAIGSLSLENTHTHRHTHTKSYTRRRRETTFFVRCVHLLSVTLHYATASMPLMYTAAATM